MVLRVSTHDLSRTVVPLYGHIESGGFVVTAPGDERDARAVPTPV